MTLRRTTPLKRSCKPLARTGKLAGKGKRARRESPQERQANAAMRARFGETCLFCIYLQPVGDRCTQWERDHPDPAHILAKGGLYGHLKFHPLNRLPVGRTHHNWCHRNPAKAKELMLAFLTPAERTTLEQAHIKGGR